MSNQKLFLWEFLISKIKFDPGAVSVPSYDSIRLMFLCSYILGTEILTDECPVDGINPDSKPNNGEFNVKIGKTCLFPIDPNELTTELQKKSLIIDLYLSTRKAGSASFKWPTEFPDFVKSSASGSKPASVIHMGSFDFIDSGGKKIAEMSMGIKLSFLGESVETAYSLKFKDAIFVNPKTNTKFKSEKPVTIDVVPSSLPMQSDSKISWIGLFERKMAAEAMSLPPFNIEEMEAKFKGGKAQDAISRLSQYWDIVSIKFRPDDNRFMDIMNMIADEVALEPSKARKETKFADTVDVHEFEGEEDNELTSEKIMKKICNNPACPAAKKFKEYGLGPLATGPGLGTMYKKVQPTKTYRLSNTYGVFTRYGPFGVFEKSEYPFFPPKEDTTEVCPIDFPCLPDEDEEVCSCYSDQEPSVQESKCSCGVRYCRLRGGEEKTVIREKLRECSCCKHRNHHQNKDIPLRLRGGGIAEEDGIESVNEFTACTICDFDNNNTIWPTSYDCDNNFYDYDQYSARLRGGGKKDDKKKEEEEKPNAMKSPMEECKPVMDQFNQILAEYKKALGPCGEASCPFSQNICGEYCKKICHAKEEPCPCMRKDSCQEMPCDIDECPFKNKQDKKIKGSCGSPHCPYAQYKLGLVTDDAELELAYLPPAVMGKCGDPKCDYPPQFLTLPPIHWDCPDPLPQGCCKNPNCPHQPKGLLELKVPVPKAPCGSASCPYALPPACDMPSCPFREKPCPFKAQKKAGVAKPSCESDSDESDDDGACCNPECPYSSKKNGGNKRLRAGSEAGSVGCSNPCCPSKKKNPACCCNQESDTEESFCDSPECPLNRGKTKGTGCFPPQAPKSDVCENPECPSRIYKRHKKDDDNEICDNDDCPYRKGMGNRDDDDVCGNPYCPYNDPPPKKNACANPKCPFSGSGHAEESDDASICSSPDCPFAQSRKKKKTDEVCGNPNCPYKPKKPKASGEVCNDCTDLLCNNPDCPNYSPPAISSGPDYCDNPMCPFSKEYQTSVCVDPFCPYAQPLPSCGIPNCPYEKKPIMFCPSPICPSKFATAVPTETSGPASSGPTSGGEKKSTRRRSSEEQKKKVDGAGDNAGQKQAITATTATTGTEAKEIKRKSPYVYSFGDQWPGVKIGHRECNPPRFRIPQKMGWMWKIQQPYFGCKMRRGWRPGCIEKSVAQMIKAFREAKGLGLLNIPDFGTGKKGRRGGDGTETSSCHVRPKPTLHITKKDGVYNIIMNPLKDPKTLAETEDPYMECTPMQFKITKNKLKAGDDDFCHCNDPPEDDSDDSELDIEFTPPAGIIHPERFKKKKNVIHIETQYNPADFAEKKKGGKKPPKKGDKKSKTGKDKKKSKKSKYVDPGYC